MRDFSYWVSWSKSTVDLHPFLDWGLFSQTLPQTPTYHLKLQKMKTWGLPLHSHPDVKCVRCVHHVLSCVSEISSEALLELFSLPGLRTCSVEVNTDPMWSITLDSEVLGSLLIRLVWEFESFLLASVSVLGKATLTRVSVQRLGR